MSITIHLTSPLRPLAEGRERLSVAAATVGEALEAATGLYPALRTRLFDRNGGLRGELRVYVNDDEVRPPAGLETPVAEGDQVVLIAPLAAG
jgi:molybdopterin converting factor small subunit